MEINFIRVICLVVLGINCFSFKSPGNPSEVQNLAYGGNVSASSKFKNYAPDKVTDGKINDDSRWLSENKNGPHWIELSLAASFKVGSLHLYSGYQHESAVSGFKVFYKYQNDWKMVPGGAIENNPSKKIDLSLVFDQPVESADFRFVFNDDGHVRIKEILLFAPLKNEGSPELGTGVAQSETSQIDLNLHHVFVNQAGYNLKGPKRFTAPISPDGSKFSIHESNTNKKLYHGEIKKNKGDFSEFIPQDHEREYKIKVTGKNLKDGESYPFRISPLFNQLNSLDPALRFMIDSRSITGSHPSAYGACAWRDGTYYTFELPSLVLLYLANPGFFEAAPIEIDYQKDRVRILSPGFMPIKAYKDEGAWETAQRYYKDLDPPVGDQIPDLIQLIHWGAGYSFLKPVSLDPSGDPLGEKKHAQTIEELAYFLYGFPAYKRYFTDKFYQQISDFTFSVWGEVGLLEVITEIGDFKGRHAPGHSIAPNLMMYEIAKREGRQNPDQYLKAAQRQLEWQINEVDPANPKIARGQRMSEHKQHIGMFMMKKNYSDLLPEGFDSWMRRWAETMFARSDNMYDFRKYDDEFWTLPPRKWSDLGSVCGYPGITVIASYLIGDEEIDKKLRILRASHFDHLFGRNPLNAASSAKIDDSFPGLDFGWPKLYKPDTCARLELCRGALNSVPAHEHYPFKPNAGFRHPEGWTAFNAAFNVSLAFSSWRETDLKADVIGDKINLLLSGPIGANAQKVDSVSLLVESKGKMVTVDLKEVKNDDIHFELETTPKSLGFKRSDKIRIQYGHLMFQKEVVLLIE